MLLRRRALDTGRRRSHRRPSGRCSVGTARIGVDSLGRCVRKDALMDAAFVWAARQRRMRFVTIGMRVRVRRHGRVVGLRGEIARSVESVTRAGKRCVASVGEHPRRKLGGPARVALVSIVARMRARCFGRATINGGRGLMVGMRIAVGVVRAIAQCGFGGELIQVCLGSASTVVGHPRRRRIGIRSTRSERGGHARGWKLGRRKGAPSAGGAAVVRGRCWIVVIVRRWGALKMRLLVELLLVLPPRRTLHDRRVMKVMVLVMRHDY